MEGFVKMENFLFSGAFWGFILILAGLIVVINGVFHTQIPAFRVIFAVVLVSLGIMILSGGLGMHGVTDSNSIVLHEETMTAPTGENKEYNIILGRGLIRLTNISLEKGNVNIKINTVLGRGDVEIPGNMPVKISANAVFGDIRFPDSTFISFGHNEYDSGGLKGGENCLYLEVNTVMGETRIISK
jgi:predicted membrane protein